MSDQNQKEAPKKTLMGQVLSRLLILLFVFVTVSFAAWYFAGSIPESVTGPLKRLQGNFLDKGQPAASIGAVIPASWQIPVLAGCVVTALTLLGLVVLIAKANPKLSALTLVLATAGGVYAFWDRIPRPNPDPDININQSESLEFAQWLAKDQPESFQEESVNRNREKDDVCKEEDFKMGFNILKMHPFQMEEANKGLDGNRRIFKRLVNDSGKYYEKNGYVVPHDIVMIPQNLGASEAATSVYFSSSEMQKGFAVNVDLEGAFKKANVGLSGNYSKKESKSTTHESATMISSAFASSFWLVVDKKKIKLDPEFVEFCVNKVNPKEYTDFKKMFETYGTHYSVASLYGSMMVEESILDSKTVTEGIEKSYGGSAEGGGGKKDKDGNLEKGGKVKVGLQFTEGYKSTISNSNGRKTMIRSGGAGGTIDGLTPGENSEKAPIKVCLRSIAEVIRPELAENKLTDEDAEKLNKVRAMVPEMLEKYLNSEGKKIAQGNAKPKIFEFRFDNLKVTESWDAKLAPDMYGKIKIKLYDGKPSEFSFGDSFGNPNEPIKEATVWSRREFLTDIARLDSGNSESDTDNLIFALPAKIKRKGDRFEFDYDLDRYFVQVFWDIDDDDDFGVDNLYGKSKAISLRQIVESQNGRLELRETDEADTFGKAELRCVFRELSMNVDNHFSQMPEYPKYIGTTSFPKTSYQVVINAKRPAPLVRVGFIRMPSIARVRIIGSVRNSKYSHIDLSSSPKINLKIEDISVGEIRGIEIIPNSSGSWTPPWEVETALIATADEKVEIPIHKRLGRSRALQFFHSSKTE